MSLTHNEIMGTAEALRQTSAYIEERWESVTRFLSERKCFVFLGSGSSFSLARSLSAMTFMHTGLPCCAVSAGDLLLHTPRYAKILNNASVICISRSGQTSEMNMALDAVKPYCDSFAALVCAADTPLEAHCGLTLRMPWAFDNSVCQTRTVTNFYFAGALILAKQLGDRTLIEDLTHITDNCSGFLERAAKPAYDIASRPWTHCVVLADAELEGIADEGALAFKEICQLPSNYYHILDSRHGPMVLFNERTLLLAALGGKDPLELDYLADMRGKGSLITAFSDMPIEMQGIESISYGRRLSHIALGLPFIMLCQLISFHKAAHTGADPDRPSGLSSWISLSKESDV